MENSKKVTAETIAELKLFFKNIESIYVKIHNCGDDEYACDVCIRTSAAAIIAAAKRIIGRYSTFKISFTKIGSSLFLESAIVFKNNKRDDDEPENKYYAGNATYLGGDSDNGFD